MQRFKTLFFTILFTCLFQLLAVSQQNNPKITPEVSPSRSISGVAPPFLKKTQKRVLLDHPRAAKIIKGELAVKLKPEFRSLTSNLSQLQSNPLLSHYAFEFGIKSFSKTFLTSKIPEGEYGRNGQKLVDLSLLHTLTFNPEKDVLELSDILMATGMFEYAEPKFEDELMYLPNDPLSQPGQEGNLLLERINALKAWEIEKGDTNVVIGVLDTGIELDHPDIINNIKYNYNDPIDGIDNDGDGYIDNFYGWDVANNDNNPTWEVRAHGLNVQGACSASPNNSLGHSGTGLNCKALPIKISNSGGSIVRGYEAIYYAADQGVKVMNLSWGGYGSGNQASQDIINYAAIQKDVLIIASAGNDDGELDFFPASYENVISVAGLDTVTSPSLDSLVERRKRFTVGGLTYSFKVDMSSLEGGISTTPFGGWGGFGGSSYSSPVVAGAAALVRSKFPQLSGIQAGELLRVTGDILDTFDVTRPESRYKIGRKLNMYRALTDSLIPSVRMTNYITSSRYGSIISIGDTITLTVNFINHLSSTNNLSVKLIANDLFSTIVDDISILGVIDSLGYKSNTGDTFKFLINGNAAANQVVEFVLILSDPTKNYYDYQGFKMTVNPAYINLNPNQINTTITSIGRFGYNNFTPFPSNGDGFNFQNYNYLYEGGFMIGTSTNQVSDCIRTSGLPSADNDFSTIKNSRYVSSSLKDEEIRSIFNDQNASNPIGISVEQRSYGWTNSPNDKYIILEYNITNNSSITYDSIFPGIFADWDVFIWYRNRANWDNTHKISYTYSPYIGTQIAGVAVLTEQAPSCYSLEFSGPNGSIESYEDFSSAEKFQSLANGIGRAEAGILGLGNEVSQVTGAKIINFAPGDKATVAFALMVAENLTELYTIAQNAKVKFVSIKSGPVPNVSDMTLCGKDGLTSITVAPNNGTTFNFYEGSTSNPLLHSGSSYIFEGITENKTLFVANADSIFTTIKPVNVFYDGLSLSFVPLQDTLTILEGTSISLTNNSIGASSYLWDFGNGTYSSDVSPTYTYLTPGNYALSLSAAGSYGCLDTLKMIIKVTSITSSRSPSTRFLKIYPNPTSSVLTIEVDNAESLFNSRVDVLNTLGSIVASYTLTSTKMDISMENQPAGVYYLKYIQGENSSHQKFLKR